MVAGGRFGILADGRPIRLSGRVVDALTALIGASGAVRSSRRERGEMAAVYIIDESRYVTA